MIEKKEKEIKMTKKQKIAMTILFILIFIIGTIFSIKEKSIKIFILVVVFELLLAGRTIFDVFCDWLKK